MPPGGARVRSGPAPDPNSLKRTRDGKEWVKLRPEGRGDVPAPPWPLPEDPGTLGMLEFLAERIETTRERWGAATNGKTAAALGRTLDALEREHAVMSAQIAARDAQEQELWAQLWKLPQAVVWEADRGHLQVAMYVRAFLESQRPGGRSADRTLARQYADSLLLTTPALHSMRYVIDESLAGARPADLLGEAAAQPPKPGRRSFRVVRDTPAESDDSAGPADQQTPDTEEDGA